MSSYAAVERIRADFPALRRQHAGRTVAYFDGPGGTQVPSVVADTMVEYLLHHNANTHWAYPSSAETDALLADARAVFAARLGGAPDEIAFGNNMTTLTFHLARTLGRQWNAGDEVVVTELDHHGNVAPWQALVRERGIVLRWLPLDTATGQLQLDRLPALLTPRTRLLAIGAASNILGTINDVARAAAIARAAGALTFVDGVHYTPHRLPDVAALGCDFFACSAYKFHGPHIGVLWGRRALIDQLDPPRLDPAPADSPEKLETGTQNHEGIVGGAAAVRWLASLAGGGSQPLRPALAAAYTGLHDREAALFAELWTALAAVPGLRLYGPGLDVPRTATLSFTLRGVGSQAVATALAGEACFVSHGDFYATTVTDRLGLTSQGLVRIGLACYSTAEEVDRVVDGVRRLAR
jgi:cysteine desulfurase family protein (TIGR01976 family)